MNNITYSKSFQENGKHKNTGQNYLAIDLSRLKEGEMKLVTFAHLDNSIKLHLLGLNNISVQKRCNYVQRSFFPAQIH